MLWQSVQGPDYGAEIRDFKRFPAPRKPLEPLLQLKPSSCAISPDGKHCQNWANHISNPEVACVLAGHADLKTTIQYYCQADKEQRQKAAEAIDNLVTAEKD